MKNAQKWINKCLSNFWLYLKYMEYSYFESVTFLFTFVKLPSKKKKKTNKNSKFGVWKMYFYGYAQSVQKGRQIKSWVLFNFRFFELHPCCFHEMWVCETLDISVFCAVVKTSQLQSSLYSREKLFLPSCMYTGCINKTRWEKRNRTRKRERIERNRERVRESEREDQWME